VAQADQCFVRTLTLGQEIAGMWEWRSGDLGSALCSVGAMTVALQNEIYRISGRPAPGGGLPHTAPPAFPGGRPGDLLWAMIPEKSSRPLVDRLAEASRAASQIMKVGYNAPDFAPPLAAEPALGAPDAPALPAPTANGHAAPASVPAPAGQGNVPVPPIGTAEQLEYSMLLARQMSLVSGEQTEAAEREYKSNLKRIEKLQAAFQ
jgi:hypothetical protein